MREVSVTRFVAETPAYLRKQLTPERIVEYEGSFEVAEVREKDEEQAVIVTATGRGLRFDLRFEPRDGNYYYRHLGDEGPFEQMESWLLMERKDEGTVLTARSKVSLSVPLPGMDRIAGWKRRGELKRLLETIDRELC